MEIGEARQHDQTDQLVMPEGPAQSQCAPLLACKGPFLRDTRDPVSQKIFSQTTASQASNCIHNDVIYHFKQILILRHSSFSPGG
jgi:hypothetical protein